MATKETAPVIYEVTLSVNREIAGEFDAWLDEHIKEMLAIEGFVDASIARPDSTDKTRVLRVCSYQLSNQAALDQYFERDAERMREDGLARFPGRFDASRRVYSLDDLPASRVCLNCDAVLAARFCQVCGQKNGPRVISLRELAGDFVDDFLDLDSRFWRSLKPLMFRPGFLTSEFVRGRRMYYTPPFRMYLIASIVFFLVVTFNPSFQSDDPPEEDVAAAQSNAELALEALAEAADEVDPDSPGGAARVAALEAAESALEEAADDGISIKDGKCDITGPVNIPGLSDARSRELVMALCRKMAAEGGAEFGRALLNNLPTMMFFFLPVLALVLKILYLFSRRFYVEHLVFALHFHAFFFVATTANVLAFRLPDFVPLKGLFAGLLTAAVSLYIPIYLFRAMRRMYGQNFVFTLVKYLLLGVAYLASLLITVTLGSLVTLLAI